MENIPADEVTWEDDQLICGRCGGELELEDDDLVEKFASGRVQRLYSTDDDDIDEEEELEEEKV